MPPPLPLDCLYYNTSPIHGIGVFTNKFIKKYTKLGGFEGEEMSITEFMLRYGRDFSYCYRLVRQAKVISAKENRNWITYLNDGIYNQSTPNYNIQLTRRKVRVIKDIQPGEELLLDYGRFYPWEKESLA